MKDLKESGKFGRCTGGRRCLTCPSSSRPPPLTLCLHGHLLQPKPWQNKRSNTLSRPFPSISKPKLPCSPVQPGASLTSLRPMSLWPLKSQQQEALKSFG